MSAEAAKLMPAKRLLRHEEAIAILRERVAPVAKIEPVPLAQASGRYLAQTVVAPRPIPGHDNAAVDGFAFAYGDYNEAKGATLRLAGESSAGRPFAGKLSAGDAVRIFTGAVVPEGLDSVAMEEDSAIDAKGPERWVRIPPGLRRGANVRLAGEDCKAGHVLLEPGQRLRPQDVASAAAAGFGKLDVFAPLKVGVFSSGDEILEPGAAFVPGGVYDANRPMLQGLVGAAGAMCCDLGVLPDDEVLVREKLAEGTRNQQVLIATGGASKSQQDHVARAIAELGQLHLWHIAVKPGRPMSFGQIGNCAVLGLPGNPVAVFVCFLVYAWPVLARLAGGKWPEAQRLALPAGFSLKKKAGRREFWRGQLAMRERGPVVLKYPRDGSGLISSLRESDGLIEVVEEVSEIREGDRVRYIPFAAFGLVQN